VSRPLVRAVVLSCEVEFGSATSRTMRGTRYDADGSREDYGSQYRRRTSGEPNSTSQDKHNRRTSGRDTRWLRLANSGVCPE